MNENELSYKTRGAIFHVYNELGPGLLENVYEAALFYELSKSGLEVARQVPLPVRYKEVLLDVSYRLDLIVAGKVIVEIKSVEQLLPVHHKQVLTYLKLMKLKLGILVNFNEDNILDGIYRKVNGLQTTTQKA